MRVRNESFETSGKDNRYGILQKNLKLKFGGNCNEIIIWANGCTYHEENGYLIPNLTLPAEKETEISLWGQRHLRYIKQHRKVLYTNLLTSNKPNGYLADLNKQAEDMFFRLVKQMTEREGIIEQLKAENQMKWVAQMNSIRNRATEIVNNELIYT